VTAVIVGTLLLEAFSNSGEVDGAVKTVTLTSADFFGGLTASSSSDPAKASLVVSFYNPGADTYISSISVREFGNITVTYPNSTIVMTTIASKGIVVTTWQSSGNSSNQIDFSVHSPANLLNSGTVSSFSYYPRTSSPVNITAGDEWNYKIIFANGQSVSGSLISQ
jgi:hypothetical protein